MTVTTPADAATSSTTASTTISPKLALGAGCYWGTEKYIVKDFQKRFPNSIARAKVGFMSPNPRAMKNPSYRQVCSGQTGHVEVLDITLNEPTPELFEELIKFFFSFHDPTTLNRQGNDVGTQYASEIFFSDSMQEEIARKVMKELQGFVDDKTITKYQQFAVRTGIVKYTIFYPAEEEHQQYLAKNPLGYCNHRFRFKSWPAPSKKKKTAADEEQKDAGDNTEKSNKADDADKKRKRFRFRFWSRA